MKYTLGWIEVARAATRSFGYSGDDDEPDGWERDARCERDFKLIVNETRTQTMGRRLRRRRRCVAEFQKNTIFTNANANQLNILHTSTRAGFVSKTLNERKQA